MAKSRSEHVKATSMLGPRQCLANDAVLATAATREPTFNQLRRGSHALATWELGYTSEQEDLAMLIGLCGGTCAGKRTVAEYLIRQHAFQSLILIEKSDVTTDAIALPDKVNGVSHSSTSKSLPTGRTFAHIDDLLLFVTKQWNRHWVLLVKNHAVLDALIRRPFFLLVGVDAPISVRWRRYENRCLNAKVSASALEDFVLTDDAHHYGAPNGLAHMIDQAQVRLVNNSNSVTDLHTALDSLDLTNEQRLRPSWDLYFMQLAHLAAQRSNCMKRQIGCVVVREKRVISTGYNGTPRGLRNCNEGGCARCNSGAQSGQELGTCLCIHAEENALLEAGRDRIREGTTLYCDTCPCLTCSVKIAQVGISEVVYSRSYSLDERTKLIFQEAGVHVRQYSPPRKGIILV